MKLDYGTLLSPSPIKLSVGTLRKPTLLEISELGFDKFNGYESFLKLTPELYYTKLKGDEGKDVWESMDDAQKESLKLFDIVVKEETLQKSYAEIFDYFFIEHVIYQDDLFILLNRKVDDITDVKSEDVHGVIHGQIFMQVLEVIQQICCIYDDEEESMDEMKFKNNLARKLYEKMHKAQKEQRKQKKADINLSLPNIISAVSNNHPSINPNNVWDMHVFSILDSFNRLRVNSMFKIDCTRVSVWGDEKKTFNSALWYTNNYEKK